MNISTTWKHYYQSLPLNEDANKNLSSFSNDSVFTPNTDFGAKIKRNFTKDIDSIIIVKAPGSSTFTTYPSMTNLGGTISKPNNKYVGLIGFYPNATAAIFDKASIVTSVEESCLTHTTFKNISDSANVATINTPASCP